MTESRISPHEAPATGARATVAPRGTRRVGPVVALSLVAGLATAAVLAIVAFAGAEEHVITGTVLLAFALGWALLAACSARWTDQPQGWAAVPAGLMALVGAGLLVLAPGAAALERLGWVWPPALLALVAWMAHRARRQLRSRTRAWLLYPVLGVLALAAAGGVYETARGSLDRRALPAEGRLVDVGGHRLYLHCSGSGSPVVVLEAGLGEGSSAWQNVAPAIAGRTRVCSYDRAGRGLSDGAPDGAGIRTAADLHMLLGRAGEPGPYVLAGHSLGAAYVLDFAQRFPAEVAGVVLVDSMTPDQLTSVPDYAAFYARLQRASGLLPSLARLGLGRVAGYDAREARSFRDEVAAIPAVLERAQALDGIGSTPLVVVTAGTGQLAGWDAAQERLAALSTNSVHHVVPAAKHASLVDDGADATASSRAIREVVRSVRQATPLLRP